MKRFGRFRHIEHYFITVLFQFCLSCISPVQPPLLNHYLTPQCRPLGPAHTEGEGTVMQVQNMWEVMFRTYLTVANKSMHFISQPRLIYRVTEWKGFIPTQYACPQLIQSPKLNNSIVFTKTIFLFIDFSSAHHKADTKYIVKLVF